MSTRIAVCSLPIDLALIILNILWLLNSLWQNNFEWRILFASNGRCCWSLLNISLSDLTPKIFSYVLGFLIITNQLSFIQLRASFDVIMITNIQILVHENCSGSVKIHYCISKFYVCVCVKLLLLFWSMHLFDIQIEPTKGLPQGDGFGD